MCPLSPRRLFGERALLPDTGERTLRAVNVVLHQLVRVLFAPRPHLGDDRAGLFRLQGRSVGADDHDEVPLLPGNLLQSCVLGARIGLSGSMDFPTRASLGALRFHFFRRHHLLPPQLSVLAGTSRFQLLQLHTQPLLPLRTLLCGFRPIPDRLLPPPHDAGSAFFRCQRSHPPKHRMVLQLLLMARRLSCCRRLLALRCPRVHPSERVWLGSLFPRLRLRRFNFRLPFRKQLGALRTQLLHLGAHLSAHLSVGVSAQLRLQFEYSLVYFDVGLLKAFLVFCQPKFFKLLFASPPMLLLLLRHLPTMLLVIVSECHQSPFTFRPSRLAVSRSAISSAWDWDIGSSSPARAA